LLLAGLPCTQSQKLNLEQPDPRVETIKNNPGRFKTR
jgi:hypothetical protein